MSCQVKGQVPGGEDTQIEEHLVLLYLTNIFHISLSSFLRFIYLVYVNV